MAASSDFKLLDRKVVDTLNRMTERNVFFRALSYWVGFRKAEVSYRVWERRAGESKWSTRALIRYAINNIGSFSSAPLHIVTLSGVLMLVFALVFGVVALAQKIADALKKPNPHTSAMIITNIYIDSIVFPLSFLFKMNLNVIITFVLCNFNNKLR